MFIQETEIKKTEEKSALTIKRECLFLKPFKALRDGIIAVKTASDPVRTLLLHLVFFVLFGGLSAIITVILFENVSDLVLAVIAVIAGAIFYTASLFYSIRKYMRFFLWVFGPCLSFIVTETLIGNILLSPFDIKLTYTQAILNLNWYLVPSIVLYILTGRLNLSSGISTFFGFAWGNLNYYLLQFRGRILFPADLSALGTALRVQAGYDWSFSTEQWVFLGVFVIYLAALIVTSAGKGNRSRPKLALSLPVLAVCAIYIYIFFGTPFLEYIGIKPSLWYTQQNGVMLNFMVNLDYSYIEEPDGYSADELTELLEEPVTPSQEDKKPDIIVVMNEAFSDIGVLGDIETNADYMPYFRSLRENTIKGYAFSSVFGGNTANSEYEFLTGNTMAFLPAGTVAYQLYTSDEDYSLTGQLGELGYTSVAMHPYESYCWNRESVYEDYGFSETYFLDDYEKIGYVRYYIGDKYNYEKLISVYEQNKEKEPETPVFLFNVTMQNHGSYYQDWVNLNKSVYLEGDSKEKYEDVDQYLSLIKKSDEALQELIGYYSEVDDPTIILIFGDHQPALDEEFYESVFGKPSEELSVPEREKLYMVPFMLWANYDIEEQDGVLTSLNYLSPLLLETAQLPMTEYQEFLSELNESVPVINSVGYLEEGGEFTDEVSDLSGEAQELIEKYRIAQYNGIFDKDNLVEEFFFLNED